MTASFLQSRVTDFQFWYLTSFVILTFSVLFTKSPQLPKHFYFILLKRIRLMLQMYIFFLQRRFIFCFVFFQISYISAWILSPFFTLEIYIKRYTAVFLTMFRPAIFKFDKDWFTFSLDCTSLSFVHLYFSKYNPPLQLAKYQKIKLLFCGRNRNFCVFKS